MLVKQISDINNTSDCLQCTAEALNLSSPSSSSYSYSADVEVENKSQMSQRSHTNVLHLKQ